MTEPLISRAEWLTVRDIAGLLHVGEETVRRWIRTKRIKAKFFGGRAGYRIRDADLRVFLVSTSRSEENPTPPDDFPGNTNAERGRKRNGRRGQQ